VGVGEPDKELAHGEGNGELGVVLLQSLVEPVLEGLHVCAVGAQLLKTEGTTKQLRKQVSKGTSGCSACVVLFHATTMHSSAGVLPQDPPCHGMPPWPLDRVTPTVTLTLYSTVTLTLSRSRWLYPHILSMSALSPLSCARDTLSFSTLAPPARTSEVLLPRGVRVGVLQQYRGQDFAVARERGSSRGQQPHPKAATQGQ